MKKLYRSTDNKMIAGVCGGLGEYFGIDAIIFRLIFIVLLFGAGAALIPYAILWLIMPKRPTAA